MGWGEPRSQVGGRGQQQPPSRPAPPRSQAGPPKPPSALASPPIIRGETEALVGGAGAPPKRGAERYRQLRRDLALVKLLAALDAYLAAPTTGNREALTAGRDTFARSRQ